MRFWNNCLCNLLEYIFRHRWLCLEISCVIFIECNALINNENYNCFMDFIKLIISSITGPGSENLNWLETISATTSYRSYSVRNPLRLTGETRTLSMVDSTKSDVLWKKKKNYSPYLNNLINDNNFSQIYRKKLLQLYHIRRILFIIWVANIINN